MRESTELKKSPAKYSVDTSKYAVSCSHVTLEEIPRLCNYQSVVVRVMSEDEAVEVKKDLIM